MASYVPLDRSRNCLPSERCVFRRASEKIGRPEFPKRSKKAGSGSAIIDRRHVVVQRRLYEFCRASKYKDIFRVMMEKQRQVCEFFRPFPCPGSAG